MKKIKGSKAEAKCIEGENMHTAGALVGLALTLYQNKGVIPNYDFACQVLRDVALEIAKSKSEIKLKR